jgi:hypothetical protein
MVRDISQDLCNATRSRIATAGTELQDIELSHPNPKQSTNLQHMQQRRLAGIVKTKEQKLGVLIEETQRGQDIVDYTTDKQDQRYCTSHIQHISVTSTRCRGTAVARSGVGLETVSAPESQGTGYVSGTIFRLLSPCILDEPRTVGADSPGIVTYTS